MHGIILAQLENYALDTYGDDVWNEIRQNAGFHAQINKSLSYPDLTFEKLLGSLLRKNNGTREEELHRLGSYIVPKLLKNYTFNNDWSLVDLLTNSQVEIFRESRERSIAILPAQLDAVKVSETKVEIVYTSPRNLPHLGIGFIEGLADHMKEPIEIEHHSLSDGNHLITVNVLANTLQQTA